MTQEAQVDTQVAEVAEKTYHNSLALKKLKINRKFEILIISW